MLHLHRASRGDALAAGLAEVLRSPVGDPFAPEIVAVPTRGVERWLSQRLSAALGARPGRADGVCANVEFPFPRALVGAALAATTGIEAADDPWSAERSVWPLLGVVDEALCESWLAPLAAHLGSAEGDDRRSRRFSTVRHLADLFDRYGVHRPELLESWSAGDQAPASADEAWQAELWRRLRARIAAPDPAERLELACVRVAENPGVVDLPERVSLFGLTRLPGTYLRLLAALARGREVHLWLLHPSPVLWARLSEEPSRPSRPSRPSGPERRSHPALVPANPLLRSWGRDATEMQAVLTAVGARSGDAMPDPPARTTLLGRVQADVRSDRDPAVVGGPYSSPAGPRPLLAPGDRSLQVHACHGRARQVEVLRDSIVHLLAADDTLEPRDVIVMCPDIEVFAPLIHATFGAARAAGGADLHVRLADRSLRQTNPLLGALGRLLDLAAGRVTASELLDLAGTAPVRARFGFDDDELSRVDGWVRSSGVRWGLDAAWRRPYHLDDVAHGTWRAGLDRVLTGVAMSEAPYGLVGSVLPLDDVDSGDIDLAGRVAELVERTGEALRAFSVAHPVGEWLAAIAAAADALMACPPAEEWQRTQLTRILDDVAEQVSASPGGAAITLRPDEVRALLADRLRGVPTRANFRTGHLTMCTLVPMRSVPHRVVCLLGLDDGAFPRRTTPDSDDLLGGDRRLGDRHIGDRDPRHEDRQLLLDALLAAEDTLVITYSGRDERTNAVRPPAVPVGELLDVVDRTVASSGTRPRDQVVTEHPLQPFDERCFVTGALLPGEAWSFDRAALHGAMAARRARHPPRDGLVALLPTMRPDPLALDDLVRFVEHPVRAFLRQRLAVTVRGERIETGDSVAIELDALEKWQVGDRLLAARLAGVGGHECVRAELARGSLPPGRLGWRVLDEMAPAIEALVAEVGASPCGGRLVDVTTPVGGRTLAGTVGDVFGDQVRTVTYSRLGAKHRLTAWVRLLALTASHPARPWTARSIGRAGNGSTVAVARIPPLGPDAASRADRATWELATIVDLYFRGMREPLPLATKTAAAWAGSALRGRDGEAAARREWATGFNAPFPHEDRDPAHRLAYGAVLDWDLYTADPPRPDEAGWGDHSSRAGCLAQRLWGGLLALEVLS